MKYRLVIIFFFLGFLLNSQEIPPIKSFTPIDYNAENQNWAISQSKNKTIYVANSKGLLEYNGSDWKLYSTPNQTITRSVLVVDDKIYTGSNMDFGYWQKDDYGKLIYTSLAENIDKLIEDEEFWNILTIKHWVIFQSLDRIYIYDTINTSFNIIEPKASITKMYLVNNEIYFQVFNEGLYKIENGTSKLIIDTSLIKKNRIVNVFNHKTGLLIITAKKGVFNYNNDSLTVSNIVDENIWKNKTIYNAKILKDGSIVLGTISNGVIVLNSIGEINYQINKSSGLFNNTVLSIFQDINDNIWVGLDNGINFINSYSPYKIFSDFSGNLGTVYSSIIFEDDIYLGTNQGLFFKKKNSNEVFKLIKGTEGQVWSLQSINGELFCGHDSGTYIIKNNKATLIANIQGTWGLKPIPGNENILLQGNYDGLHIIEKRSNSWALKNKIEGFNISSRYFEIYDKETIFISHEYNGVFKLKLDSNFTKAIGIEKQNSFKKSHNSGLIKYNNNIYYANNDGIFVYDLDNNNFIKDSIVSKLYTKENYISGKLILDNSNKLWSFSRNNLSFINSTSLSDNQELNTIPLPDYQINNMIGYENITHLKNEEYLIGTSNGYMIIDLTKLQSNNYSISINSIKTGTNEFELENTTLLKDGNFKSYLNNIYFSYNVPEYYRYLEIQYQYQLEGYNNIWSDWTTNSSHLYENLPPGEYIFNVRGRVGDKPTINSAKYNFTINKPWYLSDLFSVIYLVFGIILLVIIHFIYRSYYKKQQKIILRRTEKDLELKELENKQQLANFENENLTQNIENKNRELAISTMSLIKKNEFLGTVKEELKKINTDKSLNSIIRLINKNINDTNDWELFEEAFNNADKDFLKKVKSKHPSLTSKDLRLCAYLRLNLTSKEIAPLFNISPRSVEVKRYRLRKKMELDRDINLTEYILEL